MFNNIFFFENHVVYEVILKKKYIVDRQATEDNAIRRMRCEYCIIKATNTYRIFR